MMIEARRVIGRLATIWMPATSIRAPLKNRAAAITGRGMLTMRPANFGRHDRRMNQRAMDQAMTRLVAPVVISTLTSVGAALIPGTPSNPPTKLPSPSARMPAAMLHISGRRHAASFICWHVVSTPITRRPEASPAIAKAAAKEGANP
jgi:hypothetical protein